MKIESSAFEPNGKIPIEYTGEGEDLSPPLKITNAPAGTQTFAIIVVDPDASTREFIHWVAWNIPGDTKELPKGVKLEMQGQNHFLDPTNRYRGPLPPPPHPHRYFFHVFALDNKLNLPVGSTHKQLREAMNGHILAEAELIGLYQRQK